MKFSSSKNEGTFISFQTNYLRRIITEEYMKLRDIIANIRPKQYISLRKLKAHRLNTLCAQTKKAREDLKFSDMKKSKQTSNRIFYILNLSNT